MSPDAGSAGGESLLGRPTAYTGRYAPDLLVNLPRSENRRRVGLSDPLPFSGCDIWTAYELSWLNPKGRPEIAIAEFRVPCDSPCIVESKSVKLYLNSFAQTAFGEREAVRAAIGKDLSAATGAEIPVRLVGPEGFGRLPVSELAGMCLDGLDVAADVYTVNPDLLSASGPEVEERLCSNLLRSNCPETNQPDWGSVSVHYVGPRIDPEGLLRYIISYREHHEFHEHCVERMYLDLSQRCRTRQLTVYARYTRRGGVDINPFRSNFEPAPENVRTGRQ